MSRLVSTVRQPLIAVAVGCLALAAASTPASAAPLAFSGFEAGVTGAAVIGDVNNDGIDDHATASAGRINVRLGAPGNPTGGGSFTIDSTGKAPNGRAESTLIPSAAGDVDGDRFDDVIVAGEAGYSYVVYGAATTTGSIALAAGPRVAAIERGSITVPGGGSSIGPNTGIGDFDGDGIDDFVINQATGTTNFDGTLGVAIIRGGSRLTTLSLKTGQAPRASLITGYKNCFTTWLYWIYPIPGCTVFTPDVTPLGDVNGDGKSDILVNGIYGRSQSIVFGRSQPSTFSGTSPGAGSVYVSPLRGGSTFGPAGDVDGDGYDDLFASVGGVLRGRASFPATLPAAEPLIPVTGAQSSILHGPVGDQDGDGRDDLLFEVQTATGQPVGLRVAGLPAGATSINLTARPVIGGKDVPTIPYLGGSGQRLSKAGDLDGDRAPDVVIFAGTRAYRLTHVDGPTDPGPNPGNGPATFEVEVTASTPDGQPITGTVLTKLACGTSGETWLEGHELGTTRSIAPRAPAVGGDSCVVDWGGLNVPTIKNCSWSIAYTHEGRDIDPANGRFTAIAGLNHLKTRFICTGGTRLTEGAVPNFHSTSAWRAFGSAFISDTSATIPGLIGAAPKGVHGSVVWPTPINPNNWKYSFTLSMSGGNGAAEGVSMAFLPASNGPIPAGGYGSATTGVLGTPLGGLGVGGLGGTAVAFDVNPGTGDPLAQFIGITDTAVNGTSLNWLATAAAGVRLRGPAVKIDIVAKNGELTVATNGIVRLKRAVTLPSSAYLAFTGATSPTVYQAQAIAGFSMTRP